MQYNLPNQLTLENELWVMYSDWYRPAGSLVSVSYEIQEGYYGKMTGQYYPPRIRTVKILDCEYPVVWYPRCFTELIPHIKGDTLTLTPKEGGWGIDHANPTNP